MDLTMEVSGLTGLPLRLVQIAVVLLIALKLAHLALAGVFMDEAYYWMWGQHPALSYYDHPPLNAWLLGLSSSIFGWNLFALRLPVALSFFADIFALYLLSRRIGGAAWHGHFWLTLLLFLATPIYWMLTNYGLPDHTLLTALLFSIYFFFRFFQDRASGQAGATNDFILGALFLGLAGLAKYNAAFLGIGVGVFILSYDRPLLWQPRIYLAALLTLLLQLPVVVWNATERFASWRFILNGRHDGLSATVDGIVPLGLGILIFLSPFLFWPVGKFALSRENIVPGFGFARASFFVSTIAIVALAFTTVTLFHWNLVAYAALLPFLAVYMRPRWLIPLQAAWGIAFAVAIFVNYAIVPITNVSGWKDEATGWSYGWTDIATAAEAARVEYQAGFVAATDYTTASLLGFAMSDPDVTSLSAKQDQYDYWFDRAAHVGQDAILYADRWRPIPGGVERQFESITELKSVGVRPFGRNVNQQRIYLAKGFKPHG
jgi:4-amino-4-deoxy-L-arabinose transferase-like glycosyltransferase